MSDRDVKAEIKKEVSDNKVLLYMKGTPEQPMCGFSNTVIQILNMVGKPYASVNILEDQEKRSAIKEYSNWPTIPQLYVEGEFVGGCDITTEMYENDELKPLIEKAFSN